MSNCSIRSYGTCCGTFNQPRGAYATGIIGPGAYTRFVDGRYFRQDGLDLTSGYKGRSLLPPNGSRAASVITGTDEAALCCDNSRGAL